MCKSLSKPGKRGARAVLLYTISIMLLFSNFAFAEGDQGNLDWDVYDQLLRWQTMGPGDVPTVSLTLLTKGDVTPARLAQLRAAGFEITGNMFGMVEVNGPGKVVENLWGLDFIRQVSFPVEWTHNGSEATGLDTAISCCNVDAVHEHGFTGKGIRIAVIDDGFTGELEGTLENGPEYYKVEYDAVKDSYSLTSGCFCPDNTKHGTACADTISQIAPQSSLYLISTNGQGGAAFAGAMLAMRNLQVDVISFSIEYPIPWDHGDASSQMAQSMDEWVADYDVIFAQSAGNSAGAHYRGEFSDPDGDGYHNFSTTGNVFNDNTLHIRAYGGYDLKTVLEWDDWDVPVSECQDLDLEIYGENKKLVLKAHNNQCSGNKDPIEHNYSPNVVIHVPEGGGWTDYYIAVKNVTHEKCGRSPKPVELNIWTSDATRVVEHNVYEYSTRNLANCSEFLTVGGVYCEDSTGQACKCTDYLASSWGPATNSAVEYERIKPDVLAPTGFYSQPYGGEFWGTSASAPFAAACAALVLQASQENRTSLGDILTHNEVISILQDTAIDYGPLGADPQYGWGLIDLKAAVEEAIK